MWNYCRVSLRKNKKTYNDHVDVGSRRMQIFIPDFLKPTSSTTKKAFSFVNKKQHKTKKSSFEILLVIQIRISFWFADTVFHFDPHEVELYSEIFVTMLIFILM